MFLQKCLLNNPRHFIRLLSELLNLIGCWGNIDGLFLKKVCFSKTISRLKVKISIHVYGISDDLSCAFYWRVTADILTKLLQQCSVVVYIYLVNSQVSVYRTIGPLIEFVYQVTIKFWFP